MKYTNINADRQTDKIADSYDSFKSDASGIAKEIKSETQNTVNQIGHRSSNFFMRAFDAVRSEFNLDSDKISSYIKEQPAKGMVAAFVVGAIASLLMRRK